MDRYSSLERIKEARKATAIKRKTDSADQIFNINPIISNSGF